MKLHGELRSRKCNTGPSGRGSTARLPAWWFSAIAIMCLLMSGCSTFGRPEPSDGRWWGGRGPNTTASEKKDDTNGKSQSAPWFGYREQEKPKTVNEWMAQSSVVRL